MLIEFEKLKITKPIRGIIHIGAFECEEKGGYNNILNIDDKNIIWIEAVKEKVNEIKNKNPNIRIYNECIADYDNKQINFMISNNIASSSILNFKTHLIEHPHIHEKNRRILNTKTLKTFYKENNLNYADYNFMNLDIQGAELMALKGADDILCEIDYIYVEVNIKELYENCCLLNELDEYLTKFGFKRILIEMTQHGWGDAFYSKSS